MEDLQSLLEKINRDGVEKAEAEAKKIVDAAKAKADAFLKDARAQAEQAKKDAEKAAADYQARAAETIKQAARDIVIDIKDDITKLLTALLVTNVDKALQDEKTAADLAATAVKDLTGAGELTCGAKLAQALASQLAAKKNFTVVTDDTLGTGFTVTLDGGRVEHAYTVDVIAEELAKRLRPDLAKLVK